MEAIRVMVVDDSAVIRRLVTDALSGDPEIEVVGTASNGKLALSKLSTLKPDLLTLDIEMPEMDGLATLTALRKVDRRLPVIMFSTLTARGAVATLNALTLGASDYVTKPANVGSVTAAIQVVKSELIPKVKALCKRGKPATTVGISASPIAPSLNSASRIAQKVKVVAIGTSTGGPNALAQLFEQIPANFPVPIVIVQHMPPVFTRYLAERLQSKSGLTIREAVAGQVLKPGAVWIAPGDNHLELASLNGQWITRLTQGPLENFCRPAVDVLFRSAARTVGPGLLGVVLTGMGQDGLLGCQALQKAGGKVIVQDEATSVIWGMPGAVARANLADRILPIDAIARELVFRCSSTPETSPSPLLRT